MGPLAGEGSEFPLFEDLKDDWLKWASHIELPPEPPASDTPSSDEDQPRGKEDKVRG